MPDVNLTQDTAAVEKRYEDFYKLPLDQDLLSTVRLTHDRIAIFATDDKNEPIVEIRRVDNEINRNWKESGFATNDCRRCWVLPLWHLILLAKEGAFQILQIAINELNRELNANTELRIDSDRVTQICEKYLIQKSRVSSSSYGLELCHEREKRTQSGIVPAGYFAQIRRIVNTNNNDVQFVSPFHPGSPGMRAQTHIWTRLYQAMFCLPFPGRHTYDDYKEHEAEYQQAQLPPAESGDWFNYSDSRRTRSESYVPPKFRRNFFGEMATLALQEHFDECLDPERCDTCESGVTVEMIEDWDENHRGATLYKKFEGRTAMDIIVDEKKWTVTKVQSSNPSPTTSSANGSNQLLPSLTPSERMRRRLTERKRKSDEELLSSNLPDSSRSTTQPLSNGR